MNKNQTLIAQGAVLLLSIAYSLYMAGKLPAVVPTHWNIQGKVDGHGPKAMSLWIMPGVIFFDLILTVVLPAVSPKKYEIDRFASTFGTAMFMVTLLMAALHFVILDTTAHAAYSLSGGTYDIGRPLMVVLFLFFAALGNLLGRVRRNFFIGIRTPWTIADERVWDRTHREAGVLWLVGGLLGGLGAGLGMPMGLMLPAFIVLALVPVLRSFMIYRQLNPSGNPPAAV